MSHWRPRRAERLGAGAVTLGVTLAFDAGHAAAQPTARFPDVEEAPAENTGDAEDSTQDEDTTDTPTGAGAPAAADAPTMPPGVTPPKLLTTEPVPYPANGRGDATVVLELLVAEDGSVGGVSVVSGAEPFASAALEAARGWRFEPAVVEGEKRAVRIRLAAGFVEVGPTDGNVTETGEAPAPALPNEASTPDAPAEKVPDAIEVSVEGTRRVVGRTTLSKLEIRELPGAMGDPFRAIEALPGVTPLISGLPFYFIRGAPPGNQGYFFDGIRVPLLYHLALGPGVIHPEMVDRVDLYAGGYPARYGRFVGGVVAAESAPPLPDFHGHANIRLVDSGALVSAPFADGRATATVAGRYSYTAAMLRLIEPTIRLQYWDYQSRVRWERDERFGLEVFAFGSFDLLRQTDAQDYRIGTEFHRVDLRHDFITEHDVRGRVALTLGTDRSRDEDRADFGARTVLRDRLVGLRLDLEKEVRRTLTHRGGGDLALDRYDILIGNTDSVDDSEAIQRLFPTRTDIDIGAWSDVVVEVTPRIELVAGGRADVFIADGHARLGVDPRVAATFTVHDKVRLVHAFGLAHQPPSFVVPVPGFELTGLEDGLQHGVQSSAGVEWDLPRDVTSSLTLFQHATFNGTDLLSLATHSDALEDEELDLRSLGHTYGAELMVRRPATKRVGGFLAYTLSRSKRSFGQFSGNSSFDRRHVLNTALSFDLGRRWRAGTRFVFYSGIPVEITDSEWVSGPGGGYSRPLPPQRLRTAPFYRIDWRIQKRWRLGHDGGWWAFTAEVLNTTLHKEEVSPACPDGTCEAERIGPVTIPAIGVEAAF
jgi:TonB family protein